MNRLLTKTKSTCYPASLRVTLGSALLLSLCSANVFANRPAMDDRGERVNEVVEDNTESRPTMAADAQPEAPSSVDLMMQQQTYQTGDVVQLPAKEIQAGETLKIQLLDYPRRGMSMDKVQFEYGQPIAISNSVGKPPITRWTYNDRMVYFEYTTVLHVVAR
ncbi:MAG: hypothetical protein COA54_06350 [Thiotrichaceae bacterium]|nr:MAG: hypothetical protein COA54_06350 [Thiotrichaceae bacterium]